MKPWLIGGRKRSFFFCFFFAREEEVGCVLQALMVEVN
jgi:hypothetical protein